jgi:CheY-like chemotaxis protein
MRPEEPLALQGNLEDLPLLDIIQIVSFSKKTGYLSIEMEGGDAAIVFLDGLVVSAFTASFPPADPRLGSLPREARENAVRSRIGFALEELARLREGAFGFELTDDVPTVVGDRDIRLETLTRGLNPQELLLDLAQGLDDDRVQSAAAVEASFAAPEEALVVADEPILVGEALPPDPEEAGELEPGLTIAQEWEATAFPRHGTDTRPLPKIVLPVPSVEPDVVPPPVPEPPLVEPLAPEPLGPEPPAPEPPAPEPPAPEPPAPEPPAPEPTAVAEPAPEAEGPAVARRILLVDDEEDVREILSRHFAAAGFEIVEASDPEEAAKVASKLRVEDGSFVLVTDLGMPASGGASFHGGFEVVKRLWKMNLRPPVLMMTESLNQSLRLRARQMGVQSFVFKPTLSKLNPRQFEADLSAFASKLVSDVLPRLAEAATVRPAVAPKKRSTSGAAVDGSLPAGDTSGPFEFLKRRLQDLRQEGDANQIAVLVMKVAREFFERSVLFLVKNDEARGLGGFGLAPREETLNLLARQVTIPLGEPSVFHDVARGRRAFSGPPPPDRWLGHLMGRIGRFQSQGILIVPLVAHRETIALLFGDNPETGRAPAGVEALEVFVQQAGIALENVFLQRKLQAIEEKDRAPLR